MGRSVAGMTVGRLAATQHVDLGAPKFCMPRWKAFIHRPTI